MICLELFLEKLLNIAGRQLFFLRFDLRFFFFLIQFISLAFGFILQVQYYHNINLMQMNLNIASDTSHDISLGSHA